MSSSKDNLFDLQVTIETHDLYNNSVIQSALTQDQLCQACSGCVGGCSGDPIRTIQ